MLKLVLLRVSTMCFLLFIPWITKKMTDKFMCLKAARPCIKQRSHTHTHVHPSLQSGDPPLTLWLLCFTHTDSTEKKATCKKARYETRVEIETTQLIPLRNCHVIVYMMTDTCSRQRTYLTLLAASLGIDHHHGCEHHTAEGRHNVGHLWRHT